MSLLGRLHFDLLPEPLDLMPFRLWVDLINATYELNQMVECGLDWRAQNHREYIESGYGWIWK